MKGKIEPQRALAILQFLKAHKEGENLGELAGLSGDSIEETITNLKELLSSLEQEYNTEIKKVAEELEPQG